ncbi:MAG: hypothetical protein ACYC5A_06100 [Thermoleophilia bacterium]
MKKVITRDLLISRINALLKNEVEIRTFGEEMIEYLAFDHKYELEAGQEGVISDVLSEFMDMHDFGKKDSGFQPYIPSRGDLIRLKEELMK